VSTVSSLQAIISPTLDTSHVIFCRDRLSTLRRSTDTAQWGLCWRMPVIELVAWVSCVHPNITEYDKISLNTVPSHIYHFLPCDFPLFSSSTGIDVTLGHPCAFTHNFINFIPLPGCLTLARMPVNNFPPTLWPVGIQYAEYSTTFIAHTRLLLCSTSRHLKVPVTNSLLDVPAL
jgi:hypothetical protein